MARLIQKSGYFKGGNSTGYMKYIAKRDGVEITSDTGPVTEKQLRLIEDLLKNYPDTKELFEYEDYLTTPNRATASAYIAVALDSYLHEMEPESGYMKYIGSCCSNSPAHWRRHCASRRTSCGGTQRSTMKDTIPMST